MRADIITQLVKLKRPEGVVLMPDHWWFCLVDYGDRILIRLVHPLGRPIHTCFIRKYALYNLETLADELVQLWATHHVPSHLELL